MITVVISVGTTAECKRSSKTTVTIMGHAGPENTTIDYGVGTTATDQHGDYAFQVPEGWSGTVTPSKARVNPWSFAPAFRTYSNVQCDLRNENYKATRLPASKSAHIEPLPGGRHDPPLPARPVLDGHRHARCILKFCAPHHHK